MKGKTSTGFEYELDADVVQDMEFIEACADAQEDSLKIPKMVELALGKDQKKKLYDHVRNDKGRVPLPDIDREVTEILNALSENPETKN